MLIISERLRQVQSLHRAKIQLRQTHRLTWIYTPLTKTQKGSMQLTWICAHLRLVILRLRGHIHCISAYITNAIIEPLNIHDGIDHMPANPHPHSPTGHIRPFIVAASVSRLGYNALAKYRRAPEIVIDAHQKSSFTMGFSISCICNTCNGIVSGEFLVLFGWDMCVIYVSDCVHCNKFHCKTYTIRYVFEILFVLHHSIEFDCVNCRQTYKVIFPMLCARGRQKGDGRFCGMYFVICGARIHPCMSV